jgi:hypothetical protein
MCVVQLWRGCAHHTGELHGQVLMRSEYRKQGVGRGRNKTYSSPSDATKSRK